MKRAFVLATSALVLASCGTDSGAEPEVLATQTVEAGAVTVEIDPIAIDASGASFTITLDTHEGSLDQELDEVAALEVDGDGWTNATWDGDAPGDHHREGTLTFEPQGSADESATLTLDGFDEPVQATWDL